MKILAKLISGSHLYGTSIPGSDTDFRGIYLPTKAECYLGTVKDTIEDKTEEDTTYFSLQRFMDLASQGQSVAVEMLSTPDRNQIITSPEFRTLRQNRNLFYTKNMHSFLGFAKSMAGKYSSRVDRLNGTKAILDVLDEVYAYRDSYKGKGGTIGAIWDSLPISTNAIKSINERNTNKDKRAYIVCGRELQATVTVSHAISVIRTIHDSYGRRVKDAQQGNIDFKSVMHAFRVALQAKEIVETGDLIYPLRNAFWLTELRLGKIDFIKEGLDKRLDDLIIEVQEKMDKSNLPEKVDSKWVENFILSCYS